MKKMKFYLLGAVLMLSTLALGSCGDDDDDTYLPPNQEIVNTFKKLYPNATNVEWKQKGVYYIADCWADGREKTVWFDANANWLMTETDIDSINNLPPAVYTAFTEGEYGNWVVDDVDILEYPIKSPEYVVEVEQKNPKSEIQLFYSEDGGLLHKKDVTNTDDTIWPE